MRPAGPIAGITDRQGKGYVLHDIGWAEKYDYGTQLADKGTKAQLSDRNAACTKALSKSELIRYGNKALSGTLSHGLVSVELTMGGAVQTTRDGCEADAAGQLYGDFPTWSRVKKIATSLTALYTSDILRDERFKTAVKAWPACGAQAGHPYANQL